jgi:tetratricopeptide (TPR) repeat protein
LALARAYVGVDQVEKAWDCITQAQSMGAGIASDPSLASELANYYRQHNQYKRAIELLRPLAAQNVPRKKAELADLDAAYGDEAMRTGDLQQAMEAWEEVRELHEGSRTNEAESRLATIYQKFAEQMSARGDEDQALKYYNKLNAMTPSPTSYERSAELYQKQGNLELAIDQMNKALKAGGDSGILNRKLAAMMASRGKELIDKGEVDSGYGYLQKAQSLDSRVKAPHATVRNAHIDIETGTGYVRFSGEVWNPGPADLGAVTVKADLYDTKGAKSLWSKDQKVVDEFVPPLGVHETRAFDVVSGVPAGDPATTELRIYLNNALYKTYPLLAKNGRVGATTASAGSTNGGSATQSSAWQLAPRIQPPAQTAAPAIAPNVVPGDPANRVDTAPAAGGLIPGQSSEEKTLKDLD